MRIVVLDGYAANPGDLSWAALEALGACEIHSRTPPEQTVARAADAEIVLTNKVAMTAEVIAALPRLKYVGVLATGYNVVDTAAAAQRGIVVTNVPAYGTDSVAQMVFAHILNLCQHVAEHSATVRAGRWSASQDFCYWDHPLVELSGRTIGIVGFGRIGQATANLARAFGMRVLVHARRRPANLSADAVFCEKLAELLQRSDVVSLHCPLTDDTRGMVNAERLRMMKPTAFLINTGRGPLIDEMALAHALDAGWIAGAGLDVLSREPPQADCPLLSARNCYITPHIAWATHAARERLLGIAIDNVSAFLAGRPHNVVS